MKNAAEGGRRHFSIRGGEEGVRNRKILHVQEDVSTGARRFPYARDTICIMMGVAIGVIAGDLAHRYTQPECARLCSVQRW
jgi:hypothetical protein